MVNNTDGAAFHLLTPTSRSTVRWGGHVWGWRKISGHDFLVKGGPKADMRDITRAIIISHRVSTKDLFRYGWNTPSIHLYWNGMRGIPQFASAHCLYLILNTHEKSHFYWHQFWDKNDVENICHWNYFQIPRALSELPANWPGLTRLFGWIG